MKKLILYIVLVLSAYHVFAQDPQFSQFYSSPLYLSPSLAGATGQGRLIANYRNQWPSLPNAYTTYAVSVDNYFSNFKSGLGLLVFRDQEGGVYNSTKAGLSYAYTIEASHLLKIRPGLNASYFTRNIDYSKLDFGDELYRESLTSIEIPKDEQVHHYDFTFSLLAYTDKYWFGVTGDHLLALNKQFADKASYPDLKIAAYGGARFQLLEKVPSSIDKFISISFMYKNQAGFNQLDLGVNYEKNPFRIGVWFRGIPAFEETADLNAFVILVGYTFKDILINYSYDISTSRMLASTGGAHEISIAYTFETSGYQKRKKRAAVPCPHF